MVLSDEKKKEYVKRLLLSRMRILCNNGFYGLLLMHMKYVIDDKCQTASTNGKRIAFGPEFLDSLTDDELDFVMMHEIMHVALKHVFRCGDRDIELFNIACDIVVNSNILKSVNMNKKFITLSSYGESMHITPNGEEGYKYTAEEVYEMLLDEMKNTETTSGFDDHSEWCDQGDKEEDAEKNDEKDEDGEESKSESESDGNDDEGKSGGKDDGNKDGSGGKDGENKDGSGGKDDENEDGSGGKDDENKDGSGGKDGENKDGSGGKNDGISKNNVGNDNDKEIKDLEEEWEKRVEDVCRIMQIRDSINDRGTIPAGAERMFGELKKPQTDWRSILNDFVQEIVVDYSFTPPDRRFDDSPFFLPDFNEKDIVPHKILFMIDTSGSMSDDDITAAYSEVKGAIDQFDGKLEGWLGFFDAVVVPPEPFVNEDEFEVIKPYGGGGTRFDIIFDYVKDKMSDDQPNSIVILTDGYAPFPEESEPMDIPVLWLLNNEKVNPPWGKVARIEV